MTTKRWHEKRGKGSYWDKKLWRFDEPDMSGCEKEMLFVKMANEEDMRNAPKPEKWYVRAIGWITKNLFNGMK